MTTSIETPSARLITKPFLVAVIILGAAAVLAGPVGSWLQFRLEKLQLALIKPLAAMNVDAIYPYRLMDRQMLEPSVVEALGTTEYIHWTLEDTNVAKSDPLRRATLFVTYYTGGRDLVPHVPDECMLGAGYQPAQAHENTNLRLSALIPEHPTVPVRVCTFVRTAIHNRTKMTVVYSFAVNGTFAATRNNVRLLTADPRNTHAYFSKVEVSFPGATREQSVLGAQKLLDTVLPVLLRDHYPDFEKAEQATNEKT